MNMLGAETEIMRACSHIAAISCATMFLLSRPIVAQVVPPGAAPHASVEIAAALPAEPALLDGAGLVQLRPQAPPDPCAQLEVVSSPSRPFWVGGASTTQCGILESDVGWLSQPMGGGVHQSMLVSSLRYGITPRLDIRWGIIDQISQSGGAGPALTGIGDQCIELAFRFHEQGRRMPALAFGYGLEIPTGNPSKGFGSGFVDHEFDFIASRDLGRSHIDFNIIGTLAGDPNGHDGAAQFGLALSRPMTPRLLLTLETLGGPQPGTADRFGAAQLSLSYCLRPWLVLDSAYAKTFTAGSPRQQILFGFTYAMRPAFAAIPRGSRIAHLLGR